MAQRSRGAAAVLQFDARSASTSFPPAFQAAGHQVDVARALSALQRRRASAFFRFSVRAAMTLALSRAVRVQKDVSFRHFAIFVEVGRPVA
jgi:hypothetical protein